MTKLGRRARKRRNHDLLLGATLFLVLIGIIGGIAYAIISQPQGLDTDTLCPKDGAKGHYVLLVDKTDPLTFTQKQAFSVVVHELIEKRIPEGYLFSVFVLGEDFRETAAPIAELCNPGTGAEKSEWSANLRKLRRQYEERFVGPLVKQTEALVSTQSAKTSPIFEMMQLVGINAFRKHDVRGERRLIILSDMLHNTPQFSMYRGSIDFANFATTDYGKKAQADLRGVEIEIHYLMNSPQLQTKRNLKFWEDYFDKAGARIVSVRPLEG